MEYNHIILIFVLNATFAFVLLILILFLEVLFVNFQICFKFPELNKKIFAMKTETSSQQNEVPQTAEISSINLSNQYLSYFSHRVSYGGIKGYSPKQKNINDVVFDSFGFIHYFSDIFPRIDPVSNLSYKFVINFF